MLGFPSQEKREYKNHISLPPNFSLVVLHVLFSYFPLVETSQVVMAIFKKLRPLFYYALGRGMHSGNSSK